jgi:uncharacterized protein (TIGR02246 family)
MAGHTPEETVERLIEAFHRGDVEAALAQYEPGGTLVTAPGTVAAGPEALRQAVENLVAIRPRLTTDSYQVLVTGDLALYYSAWHLTGVTPDGAEFHQEGRSTDVLRRTPEGRWRIAIDNPWGIALLDA